MVNIFLSERRDRSCSSQNTETQRQSEEEDISSGIEDDGTSNSSQSSNRSPLVLSRLLSRSKSSLNSEEVKPGDVIAPIKNASSKTHKLSPNLGPKYPTFTSHVIPNLQSISVQKSSINSNVIHLPKEYNPAAALTAVESYYGFLSKTFHIVPNVHSRKDEAKHVKQETSQGYQTFTSEVCEESETSFTNRIFTEGFEAKLRKEAKLYSLKSHSFPSSEYINEKLMRRKRKLELQSSCNYKQIVATSRMRELQILGCLIVEIFMSKQLRVHGSTSRLNFNERLQLCMSVVKNNLDSIPRCIRYAVGLLLQVDFSDVDNIRYPTVTDLGLPPPSAHQLLQPLLRNIFPFPTNFYRLYTFLSLFQEYTNLSHELNILYHFDCNGEQCSKYENIEKTKILCAQNIGECKVKYCAKELEELLFENDTDCSQTVYILLPFVKELIEDPCTSILAAWYLFDPITKALGSTKATENLLQSILKLYENDQMENNFAYNEKIAKLYHHSFLLRLIVRLGLKTFLDNFITPLVEAVGGYKDFDRSDLLLHNHTQRLIRKTSNLKSIDNQSELDNLSPLDDESSADSDKNAVSPLENSEKELENEPEMFEFETEEKLLELSPINELVEQLEQNIANVDLQFNHSTAEEAVEAVLSDDTPSACPKSPTIPIPSSYHRSELNTIGCDVGSKKHDNTSMSDKSEFDSTLNESAGSSKCDERKLRRNNRISDVSADSLIWLSHRLGPVLTARYLSRNLLRMLTLCYVGKENLENIPKDDNILDESIDAVSIVNWRVQGDRNASKVLHCLVSIAGNIDCCSKCIVIYCIFFIAALYGEQLILLQYLPHMSELVALCKRKLTANLEGALISCLALLKHIIPYLVDSTLMDQLQVNKQVKIK